MNLASILERIRLVQNNKIRLVMEFWILCCVLITNGFMPVS